MRNKRKALHSKMALALEELQKHSSQFVYTIFLHGFFASRLLLIFLVFEFFAADNSCCRDSDKKDKFCGGLYKCNQKCSHGMISFLYLWHELANPRYRALLSAQQTVCSLMVQKK